MKHKDLLQPQGKNQNVKGWYKYLRGPLQERKMRGLEITVLQGWLLSYEFFMNAMLICFRFGQKVGNI